MAETKKIELKNHSLEQYQGYDWVTLGIIFFTLVVSLSLGNSAYFTRSGLDFFLAIIGICYTVPSIVGLFRR
jgi:hypothetical protein